MLSGSVTHFIRLLRVFSRIEPANVPLLAKCVKFGPIVPPVESILWQATQPFERKSCEPDVALPDGVLAGALWLAFQSSKPSRLSAITTNRMFAWASPQNSRHCPRYVPGSSASSHKKLLCPGTASIFPWSLGTQKLWITSELSIFKLTSRLLVT